MNLKYIVYINFTTVCSETPFSKNLFDLETSHLICNLFHIESSQLICIANQIIDFYMILLS